MKWFKHDAGAIKDEQIQYAIEEFGGDGYMLFFGLVELVAEKMDAKTGPEAEFRWKFLRQTLHVSRTKVEQFLNKCSTKLNFSYEISEEYLKICFPKLLFRLDEYTKKSRQHPDTSPDKLPHRIGHKISDQDLRTKNKDLSKDKSDIFGFTEKETHEILSEIATARGWPIFAEATKTAYYELMARMTVLRGTIKTPYKYAVESARNEGKVFQQKIKFSKPEEQESITHET